MPANAGILLWCEQFVRAPGRKGIPLPITLKGCVQLFYK